MYVKHCMTSACPLDLINIQILLYMKDSNLEVPWNQWIKAIHTDASLRQDPFTIKILKSRLMNDNIETDILKSKLNGKNNFKAINIT